MEVDEAIELAAHKAALRIQSAKVLEQKAQITDLEARLQQVQRPVPDPPAAARVTHQKAVPHPHPIRQSRLAPIQKDVTRKLKKHFQSMQTQALRSLRTEKAAGDLSLPEREQPVDDAWNRQQSQEDLGIIGKDLIEEVGAAAYGAAVEDFGLSVSWSLANPWLPGYIGKRLPLIRGVDQTMVDLLRQALTEGYAGGESIPDLSKRVTDVFKDAIGSRAELIARTETIQAYGSASLAAYADGGVQKAQMYDGDNDDSADCASVNGMVVTLDEADQLMSQEHPNGTRGVAPFIETQTTIAASATPIDPVIKAIELLTGQQKVHIELWMAESKAQRDLQLAELQAQRAAHHEGLNALQQVLLLTLERSLKGADPNPELLAVLKEMATHTPPDFTVDFPEPPPVTLNFNVEKDAFRVDAPTTVAPGAVRIEEGAIKSETPVSLTMPEPKKKPVKLAYDPAEIAVDVDRQSGDIRVRSK